MREIEWNIIEKICVFPFDVFEMKHFPMKSKNFYRFFWRNGKTFFQIFMLFMTLYNNFEKNVI